MKKKIRTEINSNVKQIQNKKEEFIYSFRSNKWQTFINKLGTKEK